MKAKFFESKIAASLILLIAIFTLGCGADVQETDDTSSGELVCENRDYSAALYTVHYKFVSGNCGYLDPAPAFTPLLNVADCRTVAEKFSDNNCTYSFVLECKENDNVHVSYFSITKQVDDSVNGWVKFDGYPCKGEYDTVLIPWE